MEVNPSNKHAEALEGAIDKDKDEVTIGVADETVTTQRTSHVAPGVQGTKSVGIEYFLKVFTSEVLFGGESVIRVEL